MKRYETFSGASVPGVVTKKVNGSTFKFIPYVISENNGEYTWMVITVRPSRYTYEGLVDAIINMHYGMDEMLAILNNYTMDPQNPKYIKEFNEMQELRKIAKKFAKEHFNIA